jgi:hypothetical protein
LKSIPLANASRIDAMSLRTSVMIDSNVGALSS